MGLSILGSVIGAMGGSESSRIPVEAKSSKDAGVDVFPRPRAWSAATSRSARLRRRPVYDRGRYQRFELFRDEAALEPAPAAGLLGEGPFVPLLNL
jgi:hypothetical protein